MRRLFYILNNDTICVWNQFSENLIFTLKFVCHWARRWRLAGDAVSLAPLLFALWLRLTIKQGISVCLEMDFDSAFPVYWPLKALYNTCHILPFTHTFSTDNDSALFFAFIHICAQCHCCLQLLNLLRGCLWSSVQICHSNTLLKRTFSMFWANALEHF